MTGCRGVRERKKQPLYMSWSVFFSISNMLLRYFCAFLYKLCLSLLYAGNPAALGKIPCALGGAVVRSSAMKGGTSRHQTESVSILETYIG